MAAASSILQRITRIAYAKHATSYYINGLPGSGKSFLLQTLGEELKDEVPRCIVLGPYQVGTEPPTVGDYVLRDWRDHGFLDASCALPQGYNLFQAWQWIRQETPLSKPQTVFVLLDVTPPTEDPLPKLGVLFSGPRRLEGNWGEADLRIHHILSSYWDHAALEKHFRDIHTSFPYTLKHNYAFWARLDPEDMEDLTKRSGHKGLPIHQRLLLDLTDGDPSVALEILGLVQGTELELPALLEATQHAACEGASGKRKLADWSQLPQESRLKLRQLVLRGRLDSGSLPFHEEPLLTRGIAQRRQVGQRSYLSFRSWYVELLVRMHLRELDLDDPETRKTRLDELVPGISVSNLEAYNLISDIENVARNYVVLYLSQKQPSTNSLLTGHIQKRHSPDDPTLEDAHQRTSEWRDFNKSAGLMTEHNPLIVYCSTRDLAGIIQEISAETQSSVWARIAKSIQNLAIVRDAVMHNQLIDDQSYRQLYDLQAEIYQALNTE